MEEIIYTCGRIDATVDILDAIDSYLKECFWFTKLDNRYKPYDHYCKLHYMQEIRYKDEIACSDFTERDENDS